VSIPLPLFNKGEGRLAEAQSGASQARAELEALRFAIANEVALAFEQLQSLQTALDQQQAASLPLTARNVELARLGYSMGLLPVFEVLQAQRQAAEANSRQLDLLEQVLQARVRLHSAIGDQLAGGHPDPTTRKQ
jgi:cobalt-zinc-cadmium efflux system outer membrane protein